MKNLITLVILALALNVSAQKVNTVNSKNDVNSINNVNSINSKPGEQVKSIDSRSSINTIKSVNDGTKVNSVQTLSDPGADYSDTTMINNTTFRDKIVGPKK